MTRCVRPLSLTHYSPPSPPASPHITPHHHSKLPTLLSAGPCILRFRDPASSLCVRAGHGMHQGTSGGSRYGTRRSEKGGDGGDSSLLRAAVGDASRLRRKEHNSHAPLLRTHENVLLSAASRISAETPSVDGARSSACPPKLSPHKQPHSFSTVTSAYGSQKTCGEVVLKLTAVACFERGRNRVGASGKRSASACCCLRGLALCSSGPPPRQTPYPRPPRCSTARSFRCGPSWTG